MNVLTIGNSFSQDATRYLNKIAKSDGIDIDVVNLCIGGCPLSRHYSNIQTDEKAYEMEYNGDDIGEKASLKETIAAGMTLISHLLSCITIPIVFMFI